MLADEVTLGPPISACAGDGLWVADDGAIYTQGQRDGRACASAIDLTTGSVEPRDPMALPLSPTRVLEMSDPVRSRVYRAENGIVTAYDCCDSVDSAVLIVPRAGPMGLTSDTALRPDEGRERLYLSYQDYDGQDWIASVQLDTGETITDVPVPSGPWTSCGAALRCAVPGLVFADANTLLVLDGATLDPLVRVSLSRHPTSAVVDPTGTRLFVADAGGDLHVLDAASLAELERLPGVGSAVDLDPRLGRLYVGDRYSGGVHVFDPATLESLGRIAQPGDPVASPADGRVYIVEEDVYQADGATLQLVTRRTTRDGGCDGCVSPSGIVVDPGSGQVYSSTYGVLGGKPGPSSQATIDALTGRVFVARSTGGYQAIHSLALYPDLPPGEPTRWIDGLYGQPLYNPVANALYLARDGRLLVLDGETLELLGGVDVGSGLALLAVDGVSGSLFAAQGARLLRFESGDAFAGAPAQWAFTPKPEPVERLPGPVYGIAVSPAFAQDSTLLVQATDRETGRPGLYRSRDAGRRWERLEGGWPDPPNDLVFAPDGRLYAAVAGIGWRAAPEGATQGEGVYISDDGGDTWRPHNAGLTHMRVGRLHVREDGTLYALAAAAAEPGHAASGPTIWTRPPGQEWMPVQVPGAGPLRLVDYAIPSTYSLAVKAHWHELVGGGPMYQSRGEELQRSDDGGRTWQRAGRGPADYAGDVVTGKTSVYWIGPEAVWRSADEGTTWAALRQRGSVDGPPFTVVVADVDGAETLFLGTEAGRVLIVGVDEAEWEGLER